MSEVLDIGDYTEYRNMAYMTAETKSLAEQLRAMEVAE